MAKLHIKGYICTDWDGIIALTDDKENSSSWYNRSIIERIENFACEHGMFGKHHNGLGGRRAIIDNCNIQIWFADKECEVEDIMESMDNLIYGGELQTKVTFVGYSEYTITGLNLDEFSIGGHDLQSEISSHYGEYCHIIIEC